MNDLLLTDEFDLDVTADGDLDFGAAEADNVRLLLADAGGLRDAPTLGAGVETLLGSKGSAALVRGRILDAVRGDGGKVQRLEVKQVGNEVTIDCVAAW